MAPSCGLVLLAQCWGQGSQLHQAKVVSKMQGVSKGLLIRGQTSLHLIQEHLDTCSWQALLKHGHELRGDCVISILRVSEVLRWSWLWLRA